MFYRGSSTKVEDAADIFVRAANMFKMAKKWAGESCWFMKDVKVYNFPNILRQKEINKSGSHFWKIMFSCQCNEVKAFLICCPGFFFVFSVQDFDRTTNKNLQPHNVAIYVKLKRCEDTEALNQKQIFVWFHVAAGEAFCRAAALQVQLGSKHQAATEYVNAGTCYKKADPNGGYWVVQDVYNQWELK